MTNNRITNKKLSIVITFCNEGREVKETLESLRVSSDETSLIIIILLPNTTLRSIPIKKEKESQNQEILELA